MINVALLAILLSSRGTISPQNPLSQKISFDIPGWTLKQTLQQLDKKTGLVFVATDDTAKDRMLIHIKDVPISDLMDHIAQIEFAKWYKDDGEYHLQRDSKAFQSWQDKALAKNIEEIRDSIKKLEAIVAKPFDAKGLAEKVKFEMDNPKQQNMLPGETANQTNSVIHAVQKYANSMPFARALDKIIPTLPIEALAKLNTSDRIVFSSQPTSLQYLLPNSQEVIRNLQTEQSAWLNATKGLGLDAANGIWEIDSPVGTGFQPIDSRCTIEVSVRCEMGMGLACDIRVFGDNGNELGSTSAQVGAIGEDYEPQPEPKDSNSVPIPAEAKLYKEILFSGLSRSDPKLQNLITPQVREVLTHPEIHPPESLVAFPILKAICDANNLNLISNSNLLTILIASLPSKGKYSLANLNDPFFKLATVTEVSNGWLSIEPASQQLSETAEINLDALGTLLRTGFVNGQINPLAFCQFAASSSQYGYMNPIPGTYIAALGNSTPYSFLNSDQKSWSTQQLVGSLDSIQLQSAFGSEGIPASELRPDQQAILLRILSGEFNHNYLHYTGFVDQQPKPTLMNEPTYAFSKGFPAGVRIKLEKSNFVSYALGTNSSAEATSMSELDLAQAIMKKDSNADNSKITRLSTESLNFSITMPERFQIYDENNQWKVKTSSQIVNNWHDLPADEVEAIQSIIKKLSH